MTVRSNEEGIKSITVNTDKGLKWKAGCARKGEGHKQTVFKKKPENVLICFSLSFADKLTAMQAVYGDLNTAGKPVPKPPSNLYGEEGASDYGSDDYEGME